jgi:hypothetical protein
MKLPTELLFLTSLLLYPTASAPTPSINRRSASFPSLRGLTTLEHDYSNSEAFSHPTKFFHESTFSHHYDGRFASAELPHHSRQFHLRLMLRAYTEAMARIGIRTWLMHGCLLGWWWNTKLMPWDTDLDFMVDEPGIDQLGNWWNMTIHHFTSAELDLHTDPSPDAGVLLADDQGLSLKKLQEDVIRAGGKKYLLEINPHAANASTRDTENVIDARWIDTATGLFIDITTVHIQPVSMDPYADASLFNTADDQELYTKDQHAYSSSQIYPLRESKLENVSVKIPFLYEELLLEEYGKKALTRTWFHGWKFDKERMQWIMDGAEEVVTKYTGEGYKGKGREKEYMRLAGEEAEVGLDDFNGV